MLSEHERRAAEVVGKVARAYARRCWWASMDDISQECWRIALEIYERGSFDDLDGFGTLVWVACMRQMGRVLYRWQMLCSCRSDHDVGKASKSHKHDGVYGRTHSSDIAINVKDGTTVLDRDVSIRQLRDDLRRRIHELIGEESSARASAAVMLDGCTPREAAKMHGVSAQEVHRQNTRVGELGRADGELCRLARRLREERYHEERGCYDNVFWRPVGQRIAHLPDQFDRRCRR